MLPQIVLFHDPETRANREDDNWASGVMGIERRKVEGALIGSCGGCCYSSVQALLKYLSGSYGREGTCELEDQFRLVVLDARSLGVVYGRGLLCTIVCCVGAEVVQMVQALR